MNDTQSTAASLAKPTTSRPAPYNEYDVQANRFLESNGLRLRITLSDSKTPQWDGEKASEPRHHYRVTLTRIGKPGRVTFDFFGSIADCAANRPARPYDVLSCVSSESSCPETFKDFCDDFGGDTDSIQSLQTFRRADSFARRLRAFLSADELNQLREIG